MPNDIVLIAFLPQGLSASADGLLGGEAHGTRRVRLWMRGLSPAPDELCVAQHLRDLPSHDAVLQ